MSNYTEIRAELQGKFCRIAETLTIKNQRRIIPSNQHEGRENEF